MHFTNTAATLLSLLAAGAATIQAELCKPMFQGSSSTTSWSVCAKATGANADPAPVKAYFKNKLGCARIVNGDAKPLVGAVQANGCTSAAFVTSNAVPGFAINAVQYSPACPPGSKGCARRRRRARQEGEERPEQQMEEVAEEDEDID